MNGATHKGLVQLNVNPGVTTGSTADGSAVTAFKPSVSNFVRDLALSPDGTALYAGGQFTSVDSATSFSNGDAVAGLHGSTPRPARWTTRSRSRSATRSAASRSRSRRWR